VPLGPALPLPAEPQAETSNATATAAAGSARAANLVFRSACKRTDT